MSQRHEAWSAEKKAALVVQILRGQIRAEQATEQHGLLPGDIDSWTRDFLAGSEFDPRRRATRPHPPTTVPAGWWIKQAAVRRALLPASSRRSRRN